MKKKGLLITVMVVLLLILGIVFIFGMIYMSLTAEPYVPDQAYLKINLAGPIYESPAKSFPSLASSGLSIRDLWFHLQRAKIDRRIRGIVIKILPLECGLAKIEEIGGLLRDFKRSGKPVVALVEEGGLREYYLGSFADKVYGFRGGSLYLHGFAAEATFIKNTFSKLGIKAEFYHTGDYKTASNMFTEDRLTPAHRESLEKLLTDFTASVNAGIAANRHVAPEVVHRLLEDSPLPNEDYLKAKLLDGVAYEDEIVDNLKPHCPLVAFSTYRKTSSPAPFRGSQQIAVVFASGEIYSGEGGGKSLLGDEVLGADTVAEFLRSARKNFSVKAVVLRIDSPGGSPSASDVILREAELLAQKKPLVVSMSDLAGSGGYWIALGGREIYAQPSTLTGSIGVLGGKFVLRDFYTKIGVSKEIVETTPCSAMFSDYREFSPAEREKVLAEMRQIYQGFLRRVSQSRKLSLAGVERLAQGRVWSGRSAVDVRLIDHLGGLNEAVAAAKRLARIREGEPVGMKIYPREKTLLDVVLQLFESRSENPLDIQARLKMYEHFYPALELPFTVKIR